MKKIALCAAAAAALAAGSAPAQQGREGSRLSMQDVPPAARAAAMFAAGNAELSDVGLDMDGGQATYEFSGQQANGGQLEIDVLPDGRVIEVEMEIGREQLPDRIMQAVRQYLPEFEPTMIERSIRTGDVVALYYELEGQDTEGNDIDVEVFDDGGSVTIQQDPSF